MILDTIVHRGIEELREKPFSLGVLALGRALDTTSTLIGVSKFGVEAEQNPLAQYFMRSYGTEQGLIFHGGGVALPLIYASGKLVRAIVEKGGSRSDALFVENMLYFAFGAIGAAAGIGNYLLVLGIV